MKKKIQKRRTISVKGTTYSRLQDWSEQSGRSIAGLVEKLVSEFLDEAGVPMPPPPSDPASDIFTF